MNSIESNKSLLLCSSNKLVSGKQIECCRVTVSRLTKNGVRYWNNQNYRKNLLEFKHLLTNDIAEDFCFKDLKRQMILFFRKRYNHLKKFKLKEKKKKIKKKQTNIFVKQKKQKDIYFKYISKKINYSVNKHLNLPLVKRSNKSRMGKGKSRITHYVKPFFVYDTFFMFDRLDKKRKKKIKEQLNYKTNLNLFFSAHT